MFRHRDGREHHTPDHWIIGSIRHGHPLLGHVRSRVPLQTSSASARPSPQDFVYPVWPNLSGIDLPTNGSTPSAQRWRATTAGLGSMPKSKNMALIFSTITSTGSSPKPSNHSQSRFSACHATPLMLYQRPIIELVKTPGRRRNPQPKGKSAVPSSSRLRSVLTASIEVRMFDVAWLGAHTVLRNRRRKKIKLSRQMPSHKPSSMLETRRTLSRARYRLARNSSFPPPQTCSYLLLSRCPIRQNKWSNQYQNWSHRPNHLTYRILLFAHLALNQNRIKMRSWSTSLRMARSLPRQSHLWLCPQSCHPMRFYRYHPMKKLK